MFASTCVSHEFYFNFLRFFIHKLHMKNQKSLKFIHALHSHVEFWVQIFFFSTWFLTPRWCWEENTNTACPQRNTSLPPSTCTLTLSISSSLSCPLLAMLAIRPRSKGLHSATRSKFFFYYGIWIMFMSDYLVVKV